jgi:hypothetical protein
MIKPSLLLYTPETRDLIRGYHELQNAITAIDLNHPSSGDAQFVISSKMGICPHIVARDGLGGNWATPIEGLEFSIAFGSWVRVSESNSSEVFDTRHSDRRPLISGWL